MSVALEMQNVLPVQADFFDDGSLGIELANLEETRHGKHSGAKLESQVALRDEVLRMLAQDMGVRAISRAMRAKGFPIGEHSILAFRARRPDLVAQEKKELSRSLGEIIRLSTDNIRERLISGAMQPSSVDLGIFIDKKAMVDGDAGLVIEHRFTVDASPDAFARRLEEMKRAKVQAVESQANVIDTKPQ